MHNPTTPAEWQEAVDAARVLLALESARIYGLITGGPGVHIQRCLELLERGAALGYTPAKDAVQKVFGQLSV